MIKYVLYLRLYSGGCISNILGMDPGFVLISPLIVMSFGICGFVVFFCIFGFFFGFDVNFLLLFFSYYYYHYFFGYYCIFSIIIIFWYFMRLSNLNCLTTFRGFVLHLISFIVSFLLFV